MSFVQSALSIFESYKSISVNFPFPKLILSRISTRSNSASSIRFPIKSSPRLLFLRIRIPHTLFTYSHFKASTFFTNAVNKKTDQQERNSYYGKSTNHDRKNYRQTSVTASARARGRGLIRIIPIQFRHIVPAFDSHIYRAFTL